MKKEKGITLIALVITIIVILILAGVTIATLTGDNGLLQKAQTAKVKNIEEQIKEKILISANAAKINNLGQLTKECLDEELIKAFGANNYEIVLVGKGFIVIVDNIEYKLENEGTINEVDKEESGIENAGDLSKASQYDGLTEKTAYRVACIEDLVEWSKNADNYKNKFIKLEKTLDFENTSDYNDYKKITTDINENGVKEALITELTTGKGFKPISKFSGTFDGQNNVIKNIYENTTGNAGLIITTERNVTVTIKNLGITGNITGSSSIGGIIAVHSGETSYLDVINCYNACTIKAGAYAGGIIAYSSGSYQSNIRIIGCYNKGDISGKYAGGLIGGGHAYNFKVYNGYNDGDIDGTISAGGILGADQWPETCTLIVYNSFNKKRIKGNNAGGIGGATEIRPRNVINFGEIIGLSDKEPGGIVGLLAYGHSADDLSTSYYLNNVNYALNNTWGDPKIGLGGYTKEQMQSQDFVDTLNNFVNTYNEEHKNDEGFINLTRWKYNEGDYPTFE